MTEINGIRVAGARLLVIIDDGKCTATAAMADASIQSGELVLQILRHCSFPAMSAVMAMVGDVQWPVGKDSIVVRQDGSPATFCFYLARSSGYRLILSESTTEDQILQVQSFLATYATLIPDRKLLPETANEIVGSSSANSPADKLQQARIMSAVSKLFCRILEKGMISPSVHVKLEAMANPSNFRAMEKAWNRELEFYREKQRIQGCHMEQGKPNSDAGEQGFGISAQQNNNRESYIINQEQGKAPSDGEKQRKLGHFAEQGKPGIGFLNNALAVAKAEAVARVAEAVRSGGKTLTLTTNQSSLVTNAHKISVNDGVINTDQNSSLQSWTLNEAGLSLLFRFIAASINPSNNSGAASARSSMPRLQSSSSSSSAEQQLSSSELSYPHPNKQPQTQTQTQGNSVKLRPQLSHPPPPLPNRRPPRPTPSTALKQ